MSKICSIILISRVIKNEKESVYNILSRRFKFYTKEVFKVLNIVAIALLIIFAIILIKYKPVYKVTISDQEMGYIENKNQLEETFNKEMYNDDSLNVAFVTLDQTPEYNLQFIERKKETNEQEILEILKDNSVTTYRLFAITVNNEPKAYVNNNDEAEQLVEDIKIEYEKDIDLNIKVIEFYTDNLQNIDCTDFVVAKTDLDEAVNREIKLKECTINGIALATKPVTGTITSRYGSMDSVRGGRSHSGLDIAAPTRHRYKGCSIRYSNIRLIFRGIW